MHKKIYLFLLLLLSRIFAEEIVYNSPLVNDSLGLIKTFVKSVLFIVLLLLLFWYWKRQLLPRMLNPDMQNKKMRIVEKLMLDYTNVLYLVEIEGVYQVYALGNKQINCLHTFNKTEKKSLKKSK